MPEHQSHTWTGRTDGPGPEHARWHSTVVTAEPSVLAEPAPSGAVAVDVIGFASDAGVARNKGRIGASDGPGALRKALASLAVHEPRTLTDVGDVRVTGDSDLEAGQDLLSERVAASVARGAVPLVLGGGHETAWGTFRGIHAGLASRSASGHDDGARPAKRLGILNLDQHFDLRLEDRPTSGTPFRQISEYLEERGENFLYAVVGISEPNNTSVGFETADGLGVEYLLDEDCTRTSALEFTRQFLQRVDALYLTLDLDVLPASVAPGVSAPAAYGVPFEIIRAVMLEAARSGKLAGLDVVELNPMYDVDSRTARSAARLIDDTLRGLPRR